jgi:hypothetical protein
MSAGYNAKFSSHRRRPDSYHDPKNVAARAAAAQVLQDRLEVMWSEVSGMIPALDGRLITPCPGAMAHNGAWTEFRADWHDDTDGTTKVVTATLTRGRWVYDWFGGAK